MQAKNSRASLIEPKKRQAARRHNIGELIGIERNADEALGIACRFIGLIDKHNFVVLTNIEVAVGRESVD